MRFRFFAFVLLFIDWISALLAWIFFYYTRKLVVEHVPFKVNSNFYMGIIIIPLLWVFLYYILGTYHDIRRLFRFKLLSLTFVSTIIGSIFVFFAFLLDDQIQGYQSYYKLVFLLFAIHFTFTLIPRMIFVSLLVNFVHTVKGGFTTLLVGGSEKAVELVNDLKQLPKSPNILIGFVKINGVDSQLANVLPQLGDLNDLDKVMRENKVEEVIIALDSTEHNKLKSIISRVEGGNVSIKILPDMYDILSGSVKMTSIFGALLLDVNAESMPVWQQEIKRFMDVILSLIAIILLIPVYIFSAIAVKLSSPGPVFFLQERIGLNGKPFKIIKFRTMYVDAEKAGPQLSSSHDPRITPIGRFMRKVRLDEFPQFVNVLKGDMSLVGPRPERQYFIDQIVKIEPHFLHLTKVKPGITSWGQVKYGYAENVDQMLQRMKYDLLYLKNRSLALDFKIMLYTVLIVLKGKGK